jgi:hypothetical protein
LSSDAVWSEGVGKPTSLPTLARMASRTTPSVENCESAIRVEKALYEANEVD